MLAINKAGACFVPLDPSHPASRLRMIVMQSECSTILTSERDKELLKGIVPSIVVVSRSAIPVSNYPAKMSSSAMFKLDCPAYCPHPGVPESPRAAW
jgi:non-ribosomal peptide synthetase component F